MKNRLTLALILFVIGSWDLYPSGHREEGVELLSSYQQGTIVNGDFLQEEAKSIDTGNIRVCAGFSVVSVFMGGFFWVLFKLALLSGDNTLTSFNIIKKTSEFFHEKKYDQFISFYKKWCPAGSFLKESPRRRLCEKVIDFSLRESITANNTHMVDFLLSDKDYPQGAYNAFSYRSSLNSTSFFVNYPGFQNCSDVSNTTSWNKQLQDFSNTMRLSQKLNNTHIGLMMQDHLDAMHPADILTISGFLKGGRNVDYKWHCKAPLLRSMAQKQ
jgi:hypothetical protein